MGAGQGYAAETWELSAEFGTPRQALHSILEAEPAGAEGLTYLLAKSIGVAPDQGHGPVVLSYGAAITPLVSHDSNVNGGIPSDTISLGGLVFDVDPEARAVSAMTAGVQVSAAMNFLLAPRTILSFSARQSHRRSLHGGFSIKERIGIASISHSFDNWFYVDASGGRRTQTKKLSDDESSFRTITLGRIIGNPRSTSDLSASFAQVKTGDVWQDRYRVDLLHSDAQIGFLRLGLERGARISGVLLPEWSAAMSYSNFIMGKPSTITLAKTVETGGDIFGVPREDRTVSIAFDRTLNDKVSGFVAYKRTNSTIEAFSENTLAAGLTINSWGIWR